MKQLLISFILFCLFAACDDGTGPEKIPPEPPKMVAKNSSSDTTAYEIMGIDALEGLENGIRIMWYEHSQRSSLDYFFVYRSEDPQGLINYPRIAQVEPDGEFIQDSVYHSYADLNELEEKVRYRYYVTAVDEKGLESQPSDTVEYELIQKASLTAPLGSNLINPDRLIFFWSFPQNPLPNGYVLRIEDEFTDDLVYVEWVEPLDDFDNNYRTHTLDSLQLRDFTVNNRPYRWRIDAIQSLHYGSESSWGTFTINWGN